jgi:hypothetical protein
MAEYGLHGGVGFMVRADGEVQSWSR